MGFLRQMRTAAIPQFRDCDCVKPIVLFTCELYVYRHGGSFSKAAVAQVSRRTSGRAEG